MKTINTVIVDDEKCACDRLEQLLKSFTQIKILKSFTDSAAAIDYLLKAKPDLIFLDVELQKASAFDIIKRLRDNFSRAQIIIITAYPQYTIKAIRNEVFDYLLKPVDIDELKESIGRYINHISSNTLAKMEQFNMLSSRELEILKHVLDGESSSEIAAGLFISVNTVNTHRRNILRKTGSRSTLELFGKKNA